MNEVIQKELDKNYKSVVKKDVQTKEAIAKQDDKFDKLKKSNATKLKDEYKGFKADEKASKDAQKDQIKQIKQTNKDVLAAVKVKQDETNKKYDDLEVKSQNKLQKELDRLESQKEKLNANYEKLVLKVETQYNKEVEANKKEQEKIEAAGQKTQEDLTEAYAEKHKKHEEKLASIGQKRDDKIVKLNEQSEKKVLKLEEGISKQRAKVDKQLEQQVPIFEEKLAEIEELIAREQQEYETKLNDINETLNSKLERRNKFLEKAENENDGKAAKIQRKEIKQLQQAADREIKTLEKAHADRKADLAAKKKELLKNNLEQIAGIEREFVNFKEDNLMQIELNKVTLADEITKTKLDTELKLLDEQNKFDEFTSKHNDESVKELKDTELHVIEQQDLAQKLLIDFNKTNKDNALQLEEDLALNLKEQQIADLQKINESANQEADRKIALAKLESDKEIANFKAELDTLVANEEALIKQHNLDNNRLASVKAEFTLNQEGLAQKYQERAEKLLEFEEAEILNRVNLKVALINEQIAKVEEELKQVKLVIELGHKQELDLYNKEIEKIAAEDQKAVQDYKTAQETKIQELVEQKKELDPKEDKNRILELDKQIDNLRKEYTTELKQKEDFIFAKTQIFQKNTELADERKKQALVEVQEMANLEKVELQAALDLIHQNKDIELDEASKRCDKTVNNSVNYKNLITNRNQQTTQENAQYLSIRVTKEEKVIEDANSLFEQRRNQSNDNLEANVMAQEDLRDQANEELKNNALQREQELESKLADIKQRRSEASSQEQSELNQEANKLAQDEAQAEKKYNDSTRSHAALLHQQQDKYEANVQDIDKKQVAETKQFEAEQSRVQKEYDIELKKGLLAIKNKLEADIKAL